MELVLALGKIGFAETVESLGRQIEQILLEQLDLGFQDREESAGSGSSAARAGGIATSKSAGAGPGAAVVTGLQQVAPMGGHWPGHTRMQASTSR